MFTTYIDGVVGRTIRGRFAPTERSGHLRASYRLFDGALDLGLRCGEFLAGRKLPDDSHVRWLELRNKIAVYRLFEAGSRSDQLGRLDLSRLDSHSRLFGTEGWGYQNISSPGTAVEAAPELNPIAIHSGVGLRIAERALREINGARCEKEVLEEFFAVSRRDASLGFTGIIQESLGLVARTMYPHLMKRINDYLGEIDEELRARFWHGAGRGIYFAPRNIPPLRAAPWKGFSMCLTEPPDETGKRNALAGFCFALTFVNLRHPIVQERFFKHHTSRFDDCFDGVQSALAVWALSEGEAQASATPIARKTAEYVTRADQQLLQGKVADEDRRRPERFFSARTRADQILARG